MSVFPGGRFEDERIALFRSLAALTSAGFTLDESLDDSLEGTLDTSLKSIIQSIQTDIRNGTPLSSAIKCHPRIVGPIEIALIRSGEASGQISGALDATATMCEERHGLKMELAAAMIYPSLVLILATSAIFFLARSVIPGLADLYAASGRTLPLITRILSSLSILIPIVLLLIALFVLARHKGWIGHSTKLSITGYLNRIPVIQNMLVAHYTSLWATIIARLLDQGSALPDSVRLAGSAMPGHLAVVFSRIASRLEEGVPTGRVFHDEPDLPTLARRLVESGDRAGDISRAMHQIEGLFRTRYEIQRRKVTALAEPLAILVAGVVILILALGIILPASDLGVLIE